MGSLWPRSGTIERYADDIRAAGAKAFFFQGGTTSAQTVYHDAAEGSAHARPVLTDAQGRWPDIFIPYSGAGYDVQVKTADDVQLTYTLSVPNPNPISVPAPPATDGLQTGMIHAEMVNATKPGFVRLNGRTIGNAASSATERANADTSNLFVYLWNNLSDAISPVSGGRGGSAAADFAANKNIQLVDMRGSTPIGLDDMGNTAAGLFTAQSFAAGHSAVINGSACGNNARTLTVGQLPAHAHTASSASAGSHNHTGSTGSESAHTHTGTTGNQSNNHTHDYSNTTTSDGAHVHGWSNGASLIITNNNPGGQVNPAGTNCGPATMSSAGVHSHTVSGTTDIQNQNHSHSFTTAAGSAHLHAISTDGAHTHAITVDPIGSGAAVDNLGNSRLVTWFIKL